MRAAITRVFFVSAIVLFVCGESFATEFATENDKSSTSAVFSNTQPITITTSSGVTPPTKASSYPSAVTVSGMSGTVTKVEVTLRGVSHVLNQMDLLLVSPTGAKYVFLSDALPAIRGDNFFTFSDTGATTLTQNFPPSGTYLPTDVVTNADTFPAPAPAGPYSMPPGATFASVFNGSNPNGTWELYGVDDTLFNPGNIISGWSLTITTTGAPQTFTNPAYLAFPDYYSFASPYPSLITVTGQTGVISNLKVTLHGVSHSQITDVDVLLVSPNGESLVLMSDTFGNLGGTPNITFDDAAPTNLNVTPINSGSYRVTDNNSEQDFFISPAPIPQYHANAAPLSSLYGFNPNGDWRLYVVDDSQNLSGMINGGWSLEITTVPATSPPLSCSGPSFSPTSFPVGSNPTNLAIADFNNDLRADVAVANQASNNVSVLLGNGNGTFGAQVQFPAGNGSYSIVAGKFDADNNFDLAVANSGANNVSILLGNGNGTFSAPTNFNVGVNPISIAAADFNNDNKPDLAVVNFGGFFFGTVSILLGNGTGGFTAGIPVRTRTQPSFVTTADLAGDGNQDLIVASFGADSVSTFSGFGNATFQLRQNLPTGAGPVSVEVADFGIDGIPDLAIANYNADTYTTCSGTSSGDFTCTQTAPAGGTNPIAITSGDYTGTDTRLPAIALSGSNTVSVFLNSIAVGLFPNAIDTADFNGDNRPDIVTANSGTNDISVLLNSCLAAKGNLFDYNDDRRTDYAVFRPTGSTYFVHSLGAGGINFGRPDDTPVPADYTGDRRTDFAVFRPESGLWLVVDAQGNPIHFLQFGLADDIPVPADFDGDVKADIAVFRPSNGTWWIRRSSDNSLQAFQWGMNGDKPVAADFDGDEKADLGIYRPSTGTWFIMRSSNGQATIVPFGTSEDKTVAGDYDGDGKADVAVWRPSTGTWYLLRSSDGGVNALNFGISTDIPVIGDFEGDGKYDFAVWRPSDGFWYVWESSDNSPSYFLWGTNGDIPLPSSYVR